MPGTDRKTFCRWGAVALFVCGLLTGGCRDRKEEVQPLIVYAAAGTAPAMKEIGAAFTEQTGVPVKLNFANSGVLAKQILAGGDAHVFFSANEKWMEVAESAGRTEPSTRQVLLTDTLVVIVPKGRTLPVDFTKPRGDQLFFGKLAVGGQSTPVGIYTKQAFSKLGWWRALQPELVMGDTAPGVLRYVALGETDAGVVFRSLAVSAADNVTLAGELSDWLHNPVRFPVTACRPLHPFAQRFLLFIKGPAADAAFKKQGWALYKGE